MPNTIRLIAPGLALTVVVASLATLLGASFPIVGGAVIGLALGLAAQLTGRVGEPLRPGIAFSSSALLRTAVVLMGMGLSFRDVVSTGRSSLAVLLTTLFACLLVAWLLGLLLRLPGAVQALIGVGTAICGASAIAAVAPVIDADDRDIATSISTIFFYNVAAAIVFPPLGRALGLDQAAFGLWAGTAINDTSSVVAAAYAYGDAAGQLATVVKLTRSTLIIPIVLVAALVMSRRQQGGVRLGRVLPWFIVAFLLVTLVNSTGFVPVALAAAGTAAAKFFIVVAMTAIGLSIHPRQIAAAGVRPLVYGFVLWAVVAGTALAVQSFGA